MRSFVWKAADSNGDRLIYGLAIKRVGEQEWAALASDLEESYYSFDTNLLPDGEYVVRALASDAPSNPEKAALVGHLDTKPFVVDNTPPSIEGLEIAASGTTATVSFEAIDGASAIKSLRVRVDDGRWMVVYPEDGIADSMRERVRATIEGLAVGIRVIQVSVSDELYNVGSSRGSLTVR
jgi:hypothetical protein